MKPGRRIRVLEQRHDWDCGVAAMAMLLDLPYGDVAARVRERIHDGRLRSRGLLLRHLEGVIASFGHRTRRVPRRRSYLEGATGILALNGGRCGRAGHWVVVKAGVVLDPSGGEAWAIDDYIAACHTRDSPCRPATLLVLDSP